MTTLADMRGLVKGAATTAAKRLRRSPLVNRLATTSIRQLSEATGREFEAFVNHLPRLGLATARLPNGRTLTLWSLGDDFTSNQIFWRGWDGVEPETTPVWFALAARAQVVFDIGAHVGLFSLLAAHANPQATVYAFEPLPPVYARLEKNCALNQVANVVRIAGAAGEADGEAELLHHDGIPSSSSLSAEFMGQGDGLRRTKVKLVALDRFVKERGIGKVDLVKIDTESTEPAVLRGMRDILVRDKPDLIIEILPNQGTLEPINALLQPLGYRGERLLPRTDRQRRIAASVSRLAGRPDPFDNFLFSTRDPASLIG